MPGIKTHTLGITLAPEVNIAPVITSNGGGTTASLTFVENGTGAVTTVTSTDANATQTRSYSILTGTGFGADGALFSIDPVTGVLRFNAAPDFEAPKDAGVNNIYDVTVAVTDNGLPALSDTQTLAVRVTDVAGVNWTGSLFNDTYTGTGENDTINGSFGNDTLNGGAGNDRIIGGSASTF